MFKNHCFPKDIILQAVYLKLKFTLSFRDIEEILSIRGVKVDHSTLQRWVYKFAHLIDLNFNKRKKKSGLKWRLDETYIKVKGEWKYLYRAVDETGKTIDFLLTHKRDRRAAHKFLIKAMSNNPMPQSITIDKSGSNFQAIRLFNRRNFQERKIEIRQSKYLNNIVEQDHRFIKWRIINGLGFKSFESAKRTLSGIEIVRMIKKNQIINPDKNYFKTFCSLFQN